MPRISGFTFVRNAELYDFPVRESIASLLPVVDELVVALGRSDDATLEIVGSIDPSKIRIIETEWDDSMRQGGRIYAQQTDIALAACRGDWCIYLQADEVLHEEDHPLILDEIGRADADRRLDGLLFRYLHFYGSYDYLGAGRSWYRREVRAIRNTGSVISWGDAQGFRRRPGEGRESLLRVRQTDVRVFHYGWVRHPELQLRKLRGTHRYWHDDAWIAEHFAEGVPFDYASAHEVARFTGEHPAVMRERIAAAEPWTRLFDPGRLSPKPPLMRLTDWIERHTGWRIGEYRNYVEL